MASIWGQRLAFWLEIYLFKEKWKTPVTDKINASFSPSIHLEDILKWVIFNAHACRCFQMIPFLVCKTSNIMHETTVVSGGKSILVCEEGNLAELALHSSYPSLGYWGFFSGIAVSRVGIQSSRDVTVEIVLSAELPPPLMAQRSAGSHLVVLCLLLVVPCVLGGGAKPCCWRSFV